MGKISGLSHVGVFCNDLNLMTEFYSGTLGLTETHRNGDRIVFLTADPEKEDHEIALVSGRDGAPQNIQQIAFRVGDVEDVRGFYKTFKDMGIEIQQTVSHGAGVSCYFYDPEGNRIEVFADLEMPNGRGYSGPIDLEKSKEELVAQIIAG